MIDYNQLNDVYVIMIMPFDLFGKGLYRYTFRMRGEEAPDLVLEDAAQVKRIYQYMEEHPQMDTEAIYEKLLASGSDETE